MTETEYAECLAQLRLLEATRPVGASRPAAGARTSLQIEILRFRLRLHERGALTESETTRYLEVLDRAFTMPSAPEVPEVDHAAMGRDAALGARPGARMGTWKRMGQV